MEANEAKGYALRVGNEAWVPPNSTGADHDAAWAMMTPEERDRTAKRFCRDLKWMAWRMKHPKFAAILEAGAECGYAMIGGRV